jgi:hypothetical protein
LETRKYTPGDSDITIDLNSGVFVTEDSRELAESLRAETGLRVESGLFDYYSEGDPFPPPAAPPQGGGPDTASAARPRPSRRPRRPVGVLQEQQEAPALVSSTALFTQLGRRAILGSRSPWLGARPSSCRLSGGCSDTSPRLVPFDLRG